MPHCPPVSFPCVYSTTNSGPNEGNHWIFSSLEINASNAGIVTTLHTEHTHTHMHTYPDTHTDITSSPVTTTSRSYGRKMKIEKNNWDTTGPFQFRYIHTRKPKWGSDSYHGKKWNEIRWMTIYANKSHLIPPQFVSCVTHALPVHTAYCTMHGVRGSILDTTYVHTGRHSYGSGCIPARPRLPTPTPTYEIPCTMIECIECKLRVGFPDKATRQDSKTPQAQANPFHYFCCSLSPLDSLAPTAHIFVW